jgi:hypothetical protein
MAELSHEKLTNQASIDAVLVDDDPLVHMVWRYSASSKAKRLLVFSDVGEFRASLSSLSQTTPIYLDSHLGTGLRGELIAEELIAMGFKQVYLATGYSQEDLLPFPDSVTLVGKAPPFE